jgi:hypothetical protein
VGFAQTHLSGTGCSDLGDIALMPTQGNVELTREGIASKYSHARETLRPGYYQVMLERFGINPDAVESKGYANILLDKLFKRIDEHYATPKQIKVIERYGFVDVGQWSFEDASKVIGILAANHWTRPHWLTQDGMRGAKDGR